MQPQILVQIAAALGEIGVAHMLTGSLASSLHGEPRSTHDVDLVVDFQPPHVGELLARFPTPRYYLSESAMREAIAHHTMFNLMDTLSGDKVDFWVLGPSDFDRSMFDRRRTESILGVKIPVATPEDTILSKLRWAKLCGGSEQQMRDVLGVHEVQHCTLDFAYIEDWARRLEVVDLWQEIQSRAIPDSDAPQSP